MTWKFGRRNRLGATAAMITPPVSSPQQAQSQHSFVRLVDWRAARRAARSCCCPAKPMVIAILPPAGDRKSPADLLLCAHHYRSSRTSLTAALAVVTDINGIPFAVGEWPEMWAA